MHLSVRASLLRVQAVTLFGVITALVFIPTAGAVDLDFNVPDGNFNVASNWIDQGSPGDPEADPPVPPTPPAPPATPPTVADRAFVRNDGTVTIDSDVSVQWLRIGATKSITIDDPENPGTPISVQVGMPGTLHWTAGEITGPEGFLSGGPDIRVGQRSDSLDINFTGTVIQDGATTKLLLKYNASRLTIGESGSTSTPTSSYTLKNGTIGTAIGGDGLSGANGNNGINVRNGHFTMLGGQIIDATPEELTTLTTQRFITVANVDGTLGNESVSTATFTGGTVDVNGGIRVAPNAHSRGYLNIDGPVDIKTGGDTSIGYHATNSVGEMTMSDGTLTIGNTSFPGRFQIGHRGLGILNMSDGTINVTRDVRVGAEGPAGGSVIYMTGGTINATELNMRNSLNNLPTGAPDEGASIILDGPTAVFTQVGSQGSRIGVEGKALFEVRQGHATLGGGGSFVSLGPNANSEGTLNLKGGKLTIGGTLGYSTNALTLPDINLTGGILEFNSSSATQTWQPHLENTGSQLLTKSNELLEVVVGGGANYPSNFDMSSGSWDLEIGSNDLLGADWFNVTHGTASLTGGALNISYINGFTPADGDTVRILRGANGVTLNSGAITLSDPNWVLQTFGGDEIQLKYVASAGVDGDYNGNGVVDAADYVLWRKNPTGFGGIPGYNTWKQNFGESGLGSGSAVPEPAAIVLAGLLVSVLLGTRQVRRTEL